MNHTLQKLSGLMLCLALLLFAGVAEVKAEDKVTDSPLHTATQWNQLF